MVLSFLTLLLPLCQIPATCDRARPLNRTLCCPQIHECGLGLGAYLPAAPVSLVGSHRTAPWLPWSHPASSHWLLPSSHCYLPLPAGARQRLRDGHIWTHVPCRISGWSMAMALPDPGWLYHWPLYGNLAEMSFSSTLIQEPHTFRCPEATHLLWVEAAGHGKGIRTWLDFLTTSRGKAHLYSSWWEGEPSSWMMGSSQAPMEHRSSPERTLVPCILSLKQPFNSSISSLTGQPGKQAASALTQCVISPCSGHVNITNILSPYLFPSSCLPAFAHAELLLEMPVHTSAPLDSTYLNPVRPAGLGKSLLHDVPMIPKGWALPSEYVHHSHTFGYFTALYFHRLHIYFFSF